MQIKYSNIGDEPLTLATVKEYLKVDFSDEDTLITNLITGVREKIEEFTGLSLVEKTIEYFEDDYDSEVLLPYPAHDEIVEVKVNGEVITNYAKSGLNQFILRLLSTYSISDTTPSDFGLYVKYTTTGNCPQGIKDEMLRLISEKYRKRGNTFNGSTTELSENSYSNLMQFCL